MRFVLKFVEREDRKMSEQKKIKFIFGDKFPSDDSGPSDIIIDNKQMPTEEIALGSRCTRNASGSRCTRNASEENSSDWREKTGSVPERNLVALKNSILTDITLEVGPENIPFQAHKLILALGSPVFEAMFYGPLAEQGEKVNIPDIMPDGFKILLRYLYGDIVILNNELEALNAWVAADKYCISKLKKDCDIYFCNCPMSSSNIWKLLEGAIFLNLIPLVSRCKQYLQNHTESSLRGEGFLDAKSETVREVLNMSSANVNELVLLKSLIHWGRHKVVSGGALSLTEVLKPLLPHIRFGALSASEFCQFLDETNDLLGKSDALAILKHLTQPLSYALPEWCCMTNWQRVRDSSATYSRKERSSDILSSSFRRKDKKRVRPDQIQVPPGVYYNKKYDPEYNKKFQKS